MQSITKEFRFDSAHQLLLENLSPEENLKLFGKCCYLHGHSYRLKVTVTGELLESGMIINFHDLKKIVNDKVIDRYDHRFLNEFEEYKNKPTTVENLVLFIHKAIKEQLKDHGISLVSTVLYETPSSYATVEEE